MVNSCQIYAKFIYARGPFIWKGFLNETEKKTYYLNISLNGKSEKRYLNLKNN